MNTVVPCSNNLSSSGAVDSLVEVMLDRTPRESKPPKGDPVWGAINNSVATNRERISIRELAQLLTQGATFSPGVFREGRRSNDTWVQQEVFALDCEKGYGLDEFFHLCAKWNIKPAFVYPSFNHQPDKPRFRAVFVCDQLITDKRLRMLVQGLLMWMFDGKEIGQPQTIDQNCKDYARFFLGTNKPLIYENFDARVNPIQLLDSYLKDKKQKDPFHYAEWVKKTASEFGIMLRGSRELGVVQKEYISHRLQESGESECGVYTTNTPHVNSPSHSMSSIIQWNDLLFEVHWNNNSIQLNHPKIRRARNGSAIEEIRAVDQLTLKDKGVLLERCRLIKEFINGERHLHHHERRILITNLQHRKGGVKWFNEGFAARTDYRPDTLVEDARRYAMKPEGCNHCPYHGECNCKTNLLQQLAPKRRECRQIKPTPPRMTLEETRQRLSEAISTCMASDENKIFVIKCDPGTGKTEELLHQNLDGVCVAFDTHRLKQEAYQRLRQQGRDIYLWPEPPHLPKELEDKLQRCYAIGAGGTVAVFTQALEHPDVKDNQQWENAVQRYLQALQDIYWQTSAFTTHDKAFQLQRNPKIHTIVFDEDFTKTLIRVDMVRLRDIEIIRKIIKESGHANYDAIDAHLKSVLHAPSRITHPQTVQKYKPEDINALILKAPRSFESPLGALFECDAYRKDASDPEAAESIFCITRQKIRDDKKVIVLSATADETICRLLFGERLEFIDLSGTETRGRLNCHTKRSYSKQSIYRDKKGFAKKVLKDKEKYSFEGVISHKFCAEPSNGTASLIGTDGAIPVLGTFGGLQGLDTLGGRDIAIYGTPYPPEYVVKLWAYLLQITVGEEAFDFDERVVEWQEFEAHLPVVSANDQRQLFFPLNDN